MLRARQSSLLPPRVSFTAHPQLPLTEPLARPWRTRTPLAKAQPSRTVVHTARTHSIPHCQLYDLRVLGFVLNIAQPASARVFGSHDIMILKVKQGVILARYYYSSCVDPRLVHRTQCLRNGLPLPLPHDDERWPLGKDALRVYVVFDRENATPMCRAGRGSHAFPDARARTSRGPHEA